MKIKKGDQIKVVVGKDKGKTGKVEKAFEKKEMVLVPGINEFKRHVKARMANEKSEIVTRTAPIKISKIALICPSCKKQTRVGYKIEKDKKVRVCRKCGKEIK